MVRSKREWYPVISPEIFGNKEVGQTIASDTKNLIGRTLVFSMNEIVSGVRPYSKVTLEVVKVHDGKAVTSVKDYEMQRSYLFRSIRKGVSKIISIFNTKDKTGKPIRVKVFAVTRKRVSQTLRKEIRRMLTEEFNKFVKDKDLASIALAIGASKPQKEVINRLNKVYPIKSVEVEKVQSLTPHQEKRAKLVGERKVLS